MINSGGVRDSRRRKPLQDVTDTEYLDESVHELGEVQRVEGGSPVVVALRIQRAPRHAPARRTDVRVTNMLGRYWRPSGVANTRPTVRSSTSTRGSSSGSSRRRV